MTNAGKTSAVLRWGPILIVVVGLLLVGIAYFLGYLPGDARGATRREWTMQTGGIAVLLALLAFLPVKFFRWVLLAGGAAFLILSLVFWFTVGR